MTAESAAKLEVGARVKFTSGSRKVGAFLVSWGREGKVEDRDITYANGATESLMAVRLKVYFGSIIGSTWVSCHEVSPA